MVERHGGKRYSPPIPPQAHCEMKTRCEWKIAMPIMRDGGGMGGQVFCGALISLLSRFSSSA